MNYYISVFIRDLKIKQFLNLIETFKRFGCSVEQVEKNDIIFTADDVSFVGCLFKLKEIYNEIRFGISQYIGLARGISKIAQFGEILMSEEIEPILIENFSLTSLGMLSIEGMKSQILVYRVDAPSTGKYEVPAMKKKVRLIPRTIMIDALQSLLSVSKWILVFGPPGSGKTIFIDQIAENWSSEKEIFKTTCYYYPTGITLKPIYNLVGQILKLDENSNIEERLKNIEKKLKELGVRDIGTSYLAIQDFIGIGDEDSILRKMELKLRIELIVNSIAEVIQCMSYKKPIVIIIEDIENMDLSSVSLIQAVMQKLSDENIQFIFSAQRPQVSIQGLKEFELIEIDRSQLIEYIQENTGEKINIPATSMFHVQQYLELYNEEKENYLYRCYLGENPMVEYNLPFYNSKTIIKRRVELLSENHRNLLFGLAVFGCEVNLSDFPIEEKNQAILDDLIQYNFLVKSAGSVRFTSPLLHEEIYNLIPDKQSRHARIADYYRRIDGYEEYAAFHFQLAENYKKAVEFYKKSAQLSFKKGGYESAINYYLQALELCRREKDIADIETLVTLNEGLADIYRAIGDEEHAMKYYKVVLDSYKEILKE